MMRIFLFFSLSFSLLNLYIPLDVLCACQLSNFVGNCEFAQTCEHFRIPDTYMVSHYQHFMFEIAT